ncbi:hypothetical protein [Nocardia jejuensis]|uniref:hypothetical protein n=1 Tax=Nocardia jejuensis TaxID=328049 RepID=UPI000AA607BC|nr:hypothetical protein [Nocardia jejuensis]
MDRRDVGLLGGVVRRVVLMGAIPVALAAGCSSVRERDAVAPVSPVAAGSGQQSTGQQKPWGGGVFGEGGARPMLPGMDGGSSGGVRPTQPGVALPGVAEPGGNRGRNPRPDSFQPGVTTPPATRPEAFFPLNFRRIPEVEAAPAIDWRKLHAPEPVTPVAPIMPPPRMLRVGAFMTAVGNDVPDAVLGPVNGGAAAIEATIATGLDSVGIDAGRSDKIAGLTLAGAAMGGATGAVLAGVPAAMFGAVPGAVIGAGVGALAGGVIGGLVTAIPTGGAGSPEGAAIGALIGAGGGAAVGAATGAALVGIPAAVAGAVVGGIAGGATGAAFGGTV